MPNYQKMYTILFNAISDVLKDLEDLNIGLAKNRLMEAQALTEEPYISQDEEEPAQEAAQEEPGGD